MSSAPQWLDEIVAEFGRGAGIQSLRLGDRGVAALAGERGTSLYLEYVYPKLTMRMTAEVGNTAEVVKKVLLLAEPNRQGKFVVRTGIMPKTGNAFFAVQIPQDSISLPILTEVFQELRRLAERFVGGVA